MFSFFSNDETDRISASIYTYVFNLFQDNIDWQALISHIEENIPKACRRLEYGDIFWKINGLNDFSFSARQSIDKFEVHVSSAFNNTTRKYFGLKLYIPEKEVWLIFLDNSLMGCKISRNAIVFSRSLKSLLAKHNARTATFIDGKQII